MMRPEGFVQRQNRRNEALRTYSCLTGSLLFEQRCGKDFYDSYLRTEEPSMTSHHFFRTWRAFRYPEICPPFYVIRPIYCSISETRRRSPRLETYYSTKPGFAYCKDMPTVTSKIPQSSLQLEKTYDVFRWLLAGALWNGEVFVRNCSTLVAVSLKSRTQFYTQAPAFR